MPCILNAANEIAVNAFLAEKIGFMQMPDVVEYTMEKCSFLSSPDLELLEAIRLRMQGQTATDFINKLKN